MRRAPFLVFFLLLAGCSTTRVDPNFDYGPAPTGYQEAVKEYFRYVLKDFDTARWDFPAGMETRGYCQEPIPPFMLGEVYWRGWAVPVYINAKNSYGAYTGWSTHWVLLRGSTPIQDFEGATFDSLIHCTAD